MTTPANPSSPKPAGDDRNLVPVDETYKAVTFEDTVNQIWQRNRKLVFALVGFIVVAILAKGGWEYLQERKELDVETAYATATSSDQLKAFIAAHADHSLAGIAQLRLADEAYTAGKSADAIASYDKALGVIRTGPLATRALVGRALAKVQAGKTAEGVADLKQLANDANQVKVARSEAAYNLAGLAVESGNVTEAQKYVDDLMKIDPAGPWAQRGMMLRASLPVVPQVTVPAPANPAAPAPAPGAKKDEPASMQIKLPGK